MKDSYITHPAGEHNGRKLMLHYWYIEKQEIDGCEYEIAKGIVTGHSRLPDSVKTYTSPVRGVRIDEKAGEAVITTENSVYYCPLEYCRFRKQDGFPDILPDYEKLKEKYRDKRPYPSIEPGKVLLTLANFCEYYFHSVYYVPEDSVENEPFDYSGWAHVGMLQDSYLINVEGTEIDLRYFPHFRNIEFYSMDTEGRPLFLENIGDVTLYAKTYCGTIKLDPGDRKEVSRENAEDTPPVLPGGDLYPAEILE